MYLYSRTNTHSKKAKSGVNPHKRNPNETDIWKVLSKVLVELFENTSLHGYRYILEPNRNWIEKFMWGCIQIVAISAAILIVVISMIQFTLNPTFTTLASQQYPIWNVPFPAISICSNNKISRLMAETYAEFLAKRSSRYSTEYILQHLKYLGRLYDYDADGKEELTRLQEILEQYDANETTGTFDVEEQMKYLSPKCDSYLVRCIWSEQEFDCSEYFKHLKTAQGYCCIFNYAHEFDDESTHKLHDVRNPETIGPDRGLTVLLNTSTDDFFYTLKNNKALSLQIFSNGDFPDQTTGAFYEQIINNGTEEFVRVSFSALKSEDSVHSYSTQQRGCLFSDELYEQFGGQYSFSECLLKCKIRSVIALCKCIPFQYPSSFYDGIANHVQKCSLNNIECLNRYRVKWQTYRPDSSVNTKGLEGELEDSLSCPDCWPLCNSNDFKIFSGHADILMIRKQLAQINFFDNTTNLSDLSVVRIFFTSPTTSLFKKDVIFTWYEILSNVGGMLGLCMGFSLICLAEIIYYFTVRLYYCYFDPGEMYESGNNGKVKLNIFSKKTIPNYKEMEMHLGVSIDNKKLFYLK